MPFQEYEVVDGRTVPVMPTNPEQRLLRERAHQEYRRMRAEAEEYDELLRAQVPSNIRTAITKFHQKLAEEWTPLAEASPID